MTYEDTNCDSLTNLTILDPPRWGWTAAGGIADLCPPHERARRKIATREFLNKQSRDRKKAARDRNSGVGEDEEEDDGRDSGNVKEDTSSSSSPSRGGKGKEKVKGGGKGRGKVLDIVESTRKGAGGKASPKKAKGANADAIAKANTSKQIATGVTASSTIASIGAAGSITPTETKPAVSSSTNAIANTGTGTDATDGVVEPMQIDSQVVPAVSTSVSVNTNANVNALLPDAEMISTSTPMPAPAPAINPANVPPVPKTHPVPAPTVAPTSSIPTEPISTASAPTVAAPAASAPPTPETPKTGGKTQSKTPQKTETQVKTKSEKLKIKAESTEMLRRYGLSETYRAHLKPKGRSKRDRFALSVRSKIRSTDASGNVVTGTEADFEVHQDAYHRGVVGKEARFKGKGGLLCDLEKSDTNHGWDEPNLKYSILIDFPLGEPDWSDEEPDDQHDPHEMGMGDNPTSPNSTGYGSPARRRRNARRGEESSKVLVTETERRRKREQVLANLPRFSQVVQWDLTCPRTPTPLVYATDVAAEFGLSMGCTLDLARSIQNQIDDLAGENVNYHVPISIKDNLGQLREKDMLQPPKYSNPKLLYGGHCATDVTTKLQLGEVKEKKEPAKIVSAAVSNKTLQSGGAKVKTITVPYDVTPMDKLPKHDLKGLKVDPIYVEVFLKRAREVNRAACKKAADGNIGRIKILENHSCHFCHLKRPKVIQYSCGNEAHCYCDLHTARRFGYKIAQAKMMGIDYCPVCALECTCYRCTSRFTTLVPQFVEECKKQGVGPEEVKFDFLLQCSRNLYKHVKRSGEAKSNTSNSTRRKNVVKKPIEKIEKVEKVVNRAVNRNVNRVVEVPPTISVSKVPREEFPAEICGGLNKDPSKRDDYNTIFTPDGARVCEEAVKKSREDEAKRKPAIVLDGNVEYCDFCRGTGNLVCCDKCPRSFHTYCLQEDTSPHAGRWECPRCADDSAEHDGVVMKGEIYQEKLLTIFKEFKDTPDFSAKISILSKIFEMIKYLIKYDYGDTFSEPVDVKLVRDYKTYVKRPMDFGTILNRMLEGEYCKIPKQKNDLIDADSATDLDIAILSVLKDVEQIWHNCFLYNRVGSSFHRMGQVLQLKSSVIRKLSFENGLNPFIRQNFDVFVKDCKSKREELMDSLKPWIPTSKYQISVPLRGAASSKRHIVVYDSNTNMVIKQYTTFAAAYSVIDFLTKLGYKSGVGAMNRKEIKDRIAISQDKPELLLFGYRWIHMDYIRSGKFKIHKSSATVKMICKVSKSVLAEFGTINEAFRAWLDLIDKRIGQIKTQDSGIERSIHFFQEHYLDGDSTIDDQEWLWCNRPVEPNKIGTISTKSEPITKDASTPKEEKAPVEEEKRMASMSTTSPMEIEGKEGTISEVNSSLLSNQKESQSETGMEVDKSLEQEPTPSSSGVVGSVDNSVNERSAESVSDTTMLVNKTETPTPIVSSEALAAKVKTAPSIDSSTSQTTIVDTKTSPNQLLISLEKGTAPIVSSEALAAEAKTAPTMDTSTSQTTTEDKTNAAKNHLFTSSEKGSAPIISNEALAAEVKTAPSMDTSTSQTTTEDAGNAANQPLTSSEKGAAPIVSNEALAAEVKTAPSMDKSTSKTTTEDNMTVLDQPLTSSEKGSGGDLSVENNPEESKPSTTVPLSKTDASTPIVSSEALVIEAKVESSMDTSTSQTTIENTMTAPNLLLTDSEKVSGAHLDLLKKPEESEQEASALLSKTDASTPIVSSEALAVAAKVESSMDTSTSQTTIENTTTVPNQRLTDSEKGSGVPLDPSEKPGESEQEASALLSKTDASAPIASSEALAVAAKVEPPVDTSTSQTTIENPTIAPNQRLTTSEKRPRAPSGLDISKPGDLGSTIVNTRREREAVIPSIVPAEPSPYNEVVVENNTGNNTSTMPITPGRSAIEVEMAASLLDFARTAATPDSVDKSLPAKKRSPIKKRAVENISGGHNSPPDNKRFHGFY